MKTIVYKTIVGAALFGGVLIFGAVFSQGEVKEGIAQSNATNKGSFFGSVDAALMYGHNEAMVLYYTDGAVSGPTPSCPSGWTEVYQGYGPHYIGILSYGWYDNGTRTNDPQGLGERPPPTIIIPVDDPPIDKPPVNGPPPPDPPPDPPPPGGGGGGGGGQGGGGDGGGGGFDPPWDPVPHDPLNPPNPDPGPFPDPGGGGGGGTEIPDPPPETVHLEDTFYLDDIAIASDDICSYSKTSVVRNIAYHSNYVTGTIPAAFASACSDDDLTCNLCKVCIK